MVAKRPMGAGKGSWDYPHEKLRLIAIVEPFPKVRQRLPQLISFRCGGIYPLDFARGHLSYESAEMIRATITGEANTSCQTKNITKSPEPS
jgi:hypothetical protein